MGFGVAAREVIIVRNVGVGMGLERCFVGRVAEF